MRIKLSKSQWEQVGMKAGWMKIAERPGGRVKDCEECGGSLDNTQKVYPKCNAKNPNYWRLYGE